MLFNGSIDADAEDVAVDVAFHLRLRLGDIEALLPRKALNRAAEDIMTCILRSPMRQTPFYHQSHLPKCPDLKCFHDMKSIISLSRGYPYATPEFQRRRREEGAERTRNSIFDD